MTIQAPISLGISVPPREHAISVHLPTWQDVVGVGNGDLKTLSALRSGYPRSNLHPDVRMLSQRCKDEMSGLFSFEIGLHVFPDFAGAEACRSYITNANKQASESISSDRVQVLRFTFHQTSKANQNCHCHTIAPLWAVIYPETGKAMAAFFWRLTGLGISSRRAEAYLRYTDRLDSQEIAKAINTPCKVDDTPVQNMLRKRIADMLTRSTIDSGPHRRLSASDVFLFPSGMSTVYHIHHMLLKWRDAGSVMMGFPYELTLKILETYGPSCMVYSSNSNSDLDALEQYLSKMASNGTRANLQAIWCECPSNPLLWTHDLRRVRKLADKYDLAVIVDDTIGSSANVDVFNVADIVITSLTKSFSGFANVLAGSATLNPDSRYYEDFKDLLDASYFNNLYIEDATQLEVNSRTYLERVAITNDTAEYLVDHLRTLAADSQEKHLIKTIHFPKGSPSMVNYTQQMRRPTETFKPGYGCLFTIDFHSVDVAARFFDNLDLCKGPSLGADVTLVLPYVQMVLQKEKGWAAGHGLRETIVRFSVGLEDKYDLLRRIKVALAAASKGSEGG